MKYFNTDFCKRDSRTLFARSGAILPWLTSGASATASTCNSDVWDMRIVCTERRNVVLLKLVGEHLQRYRTRFRAPSPCGGQRRVQCISAQYPTPGRSTVRIRREARGRWDVAGSRSVQTVWIYLRARHGCPLPRCWRSLGWVLPVLNHLSKWVHSFCRDSLLVYGQTHDLQSSVEVHELAPEGGSPRAATRHLHQQRSCSCFRVRLYSRVVCREWHLSFHYW